jgi:hypothetical protein
MANIPFVSEDFQRAFRNQFPSQTSTGRDLHVSDIVIPVVDFTPTASGASLPLNLRFATNNNVSATSATSDTTATLISSTGFFNIYYSFAARAADSDLFIRFKEIASGTTQNARTRVNLLSTNDYNTFTDEFQCFIPPGYLLEYAFAIATSGLARIDLFHYQIADVNGNLTDPFGYSPQ